MRNDRQKAPEALPEDDLLQDSTPIPSQSTSKEDKWQTILMAVACLLCLGIIGVLIYWLEVFLK